MTDRFSICLPYVLAQECYFPEDWTNTKTEPHGNFCDDAHDPGGKTFMGLTQSEYDMWRNFNGDPHRDVRQCTKVEGFAIYRGTYWEPHCKNLPPGLDLQFFDASVNEGCLEAVRILQRVLSLEVDGHWGPLTAERVASLIPAHPLTIESLITAFTDRRYEVYHESKGFRYFGSGWLRRAREIGEAALKMAAA